MLVQDVVVGLIAPHACLGCQRLGSLLCDDCIEQYFEFVQPRCAGCRKLSENFRVCSSCRTTLPLKNIFVAGNYENVSEKLISITKFEYARAGVAPMAKILAEVLARYKTEGMLLCCIPTAPSRIRQRGFDHAKLLTHQLGRILKMKEEHFLRRVNNSRQVGSNRADRLQQTKEAYEVTHEEKVKGKHIVLVDDVMTTGATLATTARLLKQAGAKSVSAIVFAQKL